MNQPIPQQSVPNPYAPSEHENTQHPGAAAVAEFLKSQPVFLTENMRLLAASGQRNCLKCIRVKDGVANVCSERVLIRTKMPGGIDGAYLISKTPSAAPPRSHWSGYPDVELVRPDFQEMATLSPVAMDRATCFEFVKWCNAVREVEGIVVIESDKAYLKQDPMHLSNLKYPDGKVVNTAFNFPFGIKWGCSVNPYSLKIAFVEAQRYDYVFISRQNSEQRNMPLVIGLNWENCILVSTQNSHTFAGDEY